MGPLLVGAAGLMGARGCCGPCSRRRPRRFAPAALGDCGARPAAAARSRLLLGVTAGCDGSCGASRLLPEVTLGLVRIGV